MKRRPFNAAEFISNEKTPVELQDASRAAKVVIEDLNGGPIDYPVLGVVHIPVHPFEMAFSWDDKGVNDHGDGCRDFDLWFSATPDANPETITLPKRFVEDAILALEEVRTGDDREVECWEIAAKLKEACNDH